jgi:hypothetical protein
MAIEFPCSCGQVLQAQDEHAGQLTRCPKCGREVTIPGVTPAPAAARPSRPEAVTSRPRPGPGPVEEDDDDRDRRRRSRSSGMSGGGIAVLVVCLVLGACMLLAVPAILIGLLLPAVQKVREAAGRMQDSNNLKQLTLAMINYADDHGGQMPPAVVYDKDGKPLYSWRVLLLPYLGEDGLYRQFHLDEPWDSPHNKQLLGLMPKVFADPATPPGGIEVTRYQVFDGPGAAFDSDPRHGLVPFDPNARGPLGAAPPGKLGLQQGRITKFPASFADGTSNTFLIVEGADPVPWTKPADLPFDPKGPLPRLSDRFAGGFNAGLADGSVRLIGKGVSEPTRRAAITINGNDPLGPDW